MEGRMHGEVLEKVHRESNVLLCVSRLNTRQGQQREEFCSRLTCLSSPCQCSFTHTQLLHSVTLSPNYSQPNMLPLVYIHCSWVNTHLVCLNRLLDYEYNIIYIMLYNVIVFLSCLSQHIPLCLIGLSFTLKDYYPGEVYISDTWECYNFVLVFWYFCTVLFNTQ